MRDRPYVICHMQSSIDGRISGDFFFTPAADAVYERDNEIRKSYQADALVSGAVTCAEIYADGFLSVRPQPYEPVAREDYTAEPCFGSYIVCIDPEGTLRWSRNRVTHRGGPEAHIIEILTEDVDDGYLSYLRELQISYLFAGAGELDLPLALAKLKRNFGIERLLLTGGGQTNWTFLQAGCIDELNLIILPMVDGNTAAAGIVDEPPARRPESKKSGAACAPAGFRLAYVEQLPADSLWLRYLPVR